MKTGTGWQDKKISREEMGRITKEVKETLAYGYPDQDKTFSSVDLWNIHRRRKTVFSTKKFV